MNMEFWIMIISCYLRSETQGNEKVEEPGAKMEIMSVQFMLQTVDVHTVHMVNCKNTHD